MRLHEKPRLFQQAIRATAKEMSIQEIFVEKDYWVTLALKAIFQSPIGKESVFKGGTALSKCYNLIERFSEDIDLVTLRSVDETAGQLKKKLKDIFSAVNAVLPEVAIEGVTNKLGMIRKTAHEYPKAFKGEYGQVRDKVIVESSWLGHYEPYSSKEISSLAYVMMLKAGQHDLIKQHAMEPFAAQVLDIRRTLCEKILSLVRFSHTQQPLVDLKMKIRHLYDLHKLLADKEINAFVESGSFEEMLNRVGNDDVEGYKNKNEWLRFHPKEALIFAKPEETWKGLENTYSNDFKELVYGLFPAASDVLATLKVVSQRIARINWNVKVE